LKDEEVRAAIASIKKHIQDKDFTKAIQEVKGHLKNQAVIDGINKIVDGLSPFEKAIAKNIMAQAVKLMGRNLTANGRVLCGAGMDCAHGAGRSDAPAEDTCSVHLARLFRLINVNLNRKWHIKNKRWARRQAKKAAIVSTNTTTTGN